MYESRHIDITIYEQTICLVTKRFNQIIAFYHIQIDVTKVSNNLTTLSYKL